MNKPPAFQFYPKDFLTDDKVAVMNLEEKGAYIILLSYCWNNNGLTKNQNELKNMCGNPKNWERIWGKVGKCFYEKKEKYFNKRLEKEYKKQKAWRKKSQLGGIQSGISRGKKLELNMKDGSTKSKPNTNSSVSSLHSSSTNKKNKNIYTQKELDSLFEKWFKRYPRIEDKGKAREKWMHLVKIKDVDPQLLEDALTGYINCLKSKQTPIEYIKHAKTFLYPGKPKDGIPGTWEEYVKYADEKYKHKPPM